MPSDSFAFSCKKISSVQILRNHQPGLWSFRYKVVMETLSGTISIWAKFRSSNKRPRMVLGKAGCNFNVTSKILCLFGEIWVPCHGAHLDIWTLPSVSLLGSRVCYKTSHHGQWCLLTSAGVCVHWVTEWTEHSRGPPGPLQCFLDEEWQGNSPTASCWPFTHIIAIAPLYPRVTASITVASWEHGRGFASSYWASRHY